MNPKVKDVLAHLSAIVLSIYSSRGVRVKFDNIFAFIFFTFSARTRNLYSIWIDLLAYIVTATVVMV